MGSPSNIDWWKKEYWWPPALPCRPLVNTYLDNEVYLWYVLIEEGDNLLFEPYEDDSIGTPPEWYEIEMSETGIDIFDDGDHRPSDYMGHWVAWAVERGIAPFQPFRICLDRPRYFRSGGYEYPEEWDVEYDWEVDQIIPISDFEASRRWEHHFMEGRIHQEMMTDRHNWISGILEKDIDAMYLDWQCWGNWENRGVNVTLTAGRHIQGHYEWRTYGMGRSSSGDRKEALKEMLKKAKEKLPHIHGNKIRNMPSQPRHHRLLLTR